MLLTRAAVREIERHLMEWDNERQILAEREAEIIEHRPANETGRRGSMPGDPTGRAAALLEQLDKDRQWVDVVTQTFERFKGTPKGTLLEARYVEHGKATSICRQLFISEKTFYDWRMDILMFAALLAMRRGLLDERALKTT